MDTVAISNIICGIMVFIWLSIMWGMCIVVGWIFRTLEKVFGRKFWE